MMGKGNANRTRLFKRAGGIQAIGLALICLSIAVVAGFRRGAAPVVAGDFDLVILNGRVIDPESKLDAVRNVGVNAGKVITVTPKPLTGRSAIDAKGLVVAPGFIDLHEPGQCPEIFPARGVRGVRGWCEGEVGRAHLCRWYAEREGRAGVICGVSMRHTPAGRALMNNRGEWPPSAPAASKAATEAEIE